MRPLDELSGDDVGFLALVAVGVSAAALLAGGWHPAAAALAALGALGFVLQCRLQRLPPEVRTALVAGPIIAAVVIEPGYQVLLFLSVTYVLYMTQSTTRLRAAIITAVIAAMMPLAHLASGVDDLGWPPWVFAHVFIFALGLVLVRQQELIRELAAAREDLARQAVGEERRRIARELHDLTGHTLAAVLLHVTGARHVLRRDLDEADAALRQAEEVGRGSLDQIRHVVAGLRTDESGTDPALASADDLRPLVEEYRRAGLLVDATIDPAIERVGGPVGTALHRIAREALANVAHHAPANRVHLDASATDEALLLDIVDRGSPAADPVDPSGHFGLIGMRERARAVGGHLDAGPTGDGWAVRVRLPLVGTTESSARAATR